jgi:hypothetical protein
MTKTNRHLKHAQRTVTPGPQVELAHLPFHAPRRASAAARIDAILGEFSQQRLMKGHPRLRGE